MRIRHCKNKKLILISKKNLNFYFIEKFCLIYSIQKLKCRKIVMLKIHFYSKKENADHIIYKINNNMKYCLTYKPTTDKRHEFFQIFKIVMFLQYLTYDVVQLFYVSYLIFQTCSFMFTKFPMFSIYLERFSFKSSDCDSFLSGNLISNVSIASHTTHTALTYYTPLKGTVLTSFPSLLVLFYLFIFYTFSTYFITRELEIIIIHNTFYYY